MRRSPLRSPPRMRGKAKNRCRSCPLTRITPACAGKRTCTATRRCGNGNHPRVCGEKFTVRFTRMVLPGSPPRMRGKDPVAHSCKGCVGITPAYAGKSCGLSFFVTPCRDHPRVCGEKYQAGEAARQSQGSPPRMRGKVSAEDFKPQTGGDHPRVCGEKQRTLAVQDEPQGSPPRMRGKVAGLCGHAGGHGITPAYAGKSRARRTASSTSWDHPRVCREKYGRFDRRCSRAGSPPRVRGKEKHHPFLPEQHGITPACAGKRTFVPLVKSTA